MVERRILVGMERDHQREDGVAVLDRGDAPGDVAAAVAQPLDLVDDRDRRIAGQDEIAMQRVRQPLLDVLDGTAGGDQRLTDHLTAEHPLPTRLRAGAAEQVLLQRLEVEDGNQVDQAFGHGVPVVLGAPGERNRELVPLGNLFRSAITR